MFIEDPDICSEIFQLLQIIGVVPVYVCDDPLRDGSQT